MRKFAKNLACMVTLACASVGSFSAMATGVTQLPSSIELIVPYTPGGAVDTLGRLVAKQLAMDTGVNVVVQNKAGAAGAIGATYVARAKPDGRTLLMGSSNTGVAKIVNDKLQYDPINDFTPVSDVAENIIIMAANRKFPADNLTDAVQLIRDNPGKYSFASPGIGTLQHLALDMFMTKLGLDVVHVPYKGASPAMADTAGGTVPLVGGGVAPALSFLKDGSIKILGIANPDDGMFDDIPEVKGVQYFQEIQKESAVQSWIGLFAPSGVNESMIDALHDAVQKVVASNAFKEEIKPLSMVPNISSRQVFTKKVNDGFEFWKKNVPDSARAGNSP